MDQSAKLLFQPRVWTDDADDPNQQKIKIFQGEQL
jgi:hypothetical protein